MAISIVTNFDIGAPLPIDSRSVVQNITDRDNIQFKYAGLKVYVLDLGITYVYGTNNLWKQDGGGSTNINNEYDQSDGNGIYGGSGSLVDDTFVFFGTVSNTIGNRSSMLVPISEGFTDKDKNFIQNYFYRKANGSDYDTMAYIMEQKFIPAGVSVKQGPYIEFNGQSNVYSNTKGSLVLGVPDATLTSKLPKLEINSYDTIVYSTIIEPPMVFTKIGNKTCFGFNVSLAAEAENYRAQTDVAAFRMSYSIQPNLTNWDFDIIPDSGTGDTWTTVFRINNNFNPLNVSSTLGFLVDNSNRDWDLQSTRTPSLLTPQSVVRDIAHKYTRIQMWGQGTSCTLSRGVLYIPVDGNSFEFSMPAGESFADIKWQRTSTSQIDIPNGTIITIKFYNDNLSRPGFLQLVSPTYPNSFIYSPVSDGTFNGGLTFSSRLTIDYPDTSISGVRINRGDIITFRRFSGYWEIMNVDRTNRVRTRTWYNSGIDGNWRFDTPAFFLDKNYKWNTLVSSVVDYNWSDTSGNDPFVDLQFPGSTVNIAPNKINYSDAANRLTINNEGFKFKISVDGNKIVFLQGNFKVYLRNPIVNGGSSESSNPTFWLWNNEAGQGYRENFLKIGQITNVFMQPELETVWTYVNVYAWEDPISGTRRQIDIRDAMLSVSRTGHIFLRYKAYATNINQFDSLQSINMDVRVPPLSYTSATFSFGGGGGGGIV